MGTIPKAMKCLQRFVHARMDSNLISEEALDGAITYSGGVFRELARIMRTAIGRARRRKVPKIDN